MVYSSIQFIYTTYNWRKTRLTNYLQKIMDATPLQKSLTIIILVLFIELCLVVDSFNKYREHRKHSTLADNIDEDDDDEFALHNECYYRYVDTDHHYAFLHWLQRKNVSHYAPITPSNEKVLRNIQPDDIKDGLQITTGTPQGCGDRRRRMKPIHANMPIIDRALCPYEYTLNYKPNRIPATLSEVKCTCTRPFATIGRAGGAGGGAQLECEPLYYHVRVLLFESEYSFFVVVDLFYFYFL
ncbi:hypothetical protein GPALN_004566 [Globodera pallida]|nr:hypothetical protein GPALN_004566 [Globodera pallida]